MVELISKEYNFVGAGVGGCEVFGGGVLREGSSGS